MNSYGCSCRGGCTLLALGASIILGIIAAVLTFLGNITVGTAFLWVVFGIAVSYLAILLVVAATSRGFTTRRCICPLLSILITGILGAIITSVILLAITFAATSGIGAIIVGLLVAFFFLIITVTACLVKCVARCDDEETL